ncbi:arabinosyltransferase domain-containing protein [Actinomycetospora cinnamomea]|uniref:EmbC-like arabinotransferase in arabinogalactan biosynthesis n=1 Tax=Actinomycetospora cinnamomea TaxID=663609 RepID=A0A2U1FC03_9PSEU|nr:arabinosyltransferase domain-containing protein [Actinomycetospora cinnamomea]PVZ09510.1 EmbC-like arabinotransferase in arabinogalactan biosynthesis [Actinomycetospora cinnamomea]
MLTSEQTVSPPRPGSDISETPEAGRPTRGPRWLRLLAVGLGLLGTVLAVLFPFLPVVQDTATITWPSATTGTRPVDAPLVAYRPETMSITVPCRAVQDLDARTGPAATVVSTYPPLSPDGPQVGMRLSVENGQLVLNDRGQQMATAPVPAGDCTVRVTSDAGSTLIDLGIGQEIRLPFDARPQVVGIYSDLDDSRDDVSGVAVSITPDTRFETSPTALKYLAGVLAVLATAGGVWALHALDVRAGRRAPRLAPKGWWWPTGRDVVVTAVLGIWAVIGSQTSDDGYILGIARARESAGYIGNYYRWFNVPEAPFGWFYELYALWIRVDDSVLWLRVPSLLMGIVSWLLISREMLPRLGQQVRRSKAAAWAAAMVFLAFWLPYNNGLRPEPVVVISALLAFCAVERGVATRRLAPVALGLLAAAFAVAATPTGFIAVAPFLAAARPLWKLVSERVRFGGWLPVMAPVFASGLLVLVVIYADQTWAAVWEATRLRTLMGPNWSWFQEVVRYQSLFGTAADGSLARRFPVLLLMLGIAVCIVVLLRRDKITGAALGPSQRLIGSSVVAFAVLALTPTKWTHHFGAFAALGAGMAALTALATSSDVLRSRRNRLLFLAALFVVLALAFTGPNTWWYTSNWGVPFNAGPPFWTGWPFGIEPWPVYSLCLVVAVILLILAGIEHIRGVPRPEPTGEDDGPPSAASTAVGAVLAPPRKALGKLRRTRGGSTVERRARALRIGSAPIALVCAALLVFEMWSMTEGIEAQEGSFSLGGDVLEHPFGGSCGLADAVRVEGSTLAGVLETAPPPTGLAPSAPGVLPSVAPPTPTTSPTGGSGGAGDSDATATDGGGTTTTTPPSTTTTSPGASATPSPAPLPSGTVPASAPEAQLVDPQPANTGFSAAGAEPPVGGGTGVSGFEYSLRNGLADQALGSYDAEGTGTGVLRTDWYRLDDELRSGETPLVLSVAGRLNGGNFLTIQYADRLPDGRVRILGQDPIDDGAFGEPPWREIRLNLAGGLGAQADEVRLIAQDRALGPDGWLAIAPMRGPQLVPLTEILGPAYPGYLEWPVQFASPCLRPFDVNDGIAEVARYRLIADASQLRPGGINWSQASAGGPQGWIDVLERRSELPTYLEGQPWRDWGVVQRLDPYTPDSASPTVVRGEREVWGTYTPGPIGDPPPGTPSPER